MLPKAHLTSHSRMSGCRWVIIPSWLSGSWRYFLYSSVYSYHLFLISSASVRSIPFLSFFEPIFAWNVLFVSLIFLKRSLVFPILLHFFLLFLCIDHWGRLSYLSLLFFGPWSDHMDHSLVYQGRPYVITGSLKMEERCPRRCSEKEMWLWKQRQRDAVLLLWRERKGPASQRMWVSFKVGKGKETDCLLEPPERNTALLTP